VDGKSIWAITEVIVNASVTFAATSNDSVKLKFVFADGLRSVTAGGISSTNVKFVVSVLFKFPFSSVANIVMLWVPSSDVFVKERFRKLM